MTITVRAYRTEDDAAARAIYEEAFPASLRAPWSDIADHRDDERLLLLVEDDITVLALTLLRHLGDTDMAFIRYFAVDSSQRGRGLGTHLVAGLRPLLRDEGVGVLLLDVEEPMGEHAQDDRRRIEFYERCGLSRLDVPGYAPPDHGQTGEVVPLLLMGEVLDGGVPLAGARLDDAVRAVMLHRYGIGD